jgi:AcrR family transcriptional regulator
LFYQLVNQYLLATSRTTVGGVTQKPDGRRVRYEHRRGEILAAVTEHALEHGVAGLTLRGAASAVGVSHATLVHHFATRDALIAEIVDVVLTRALLPAPESIAAGYDLRAAWAYLRTGEGLRWARLFVSLVGLSLYGDPPFAVALRRSLERRLGALEQGMVFLGCPPEEAPAAATSVLTRLRGLAVDLLVTGDGERVDAAFELFLEEAAARRASWAARRG